MKVTYSVILALATLTCLHAFPAKPDSKEEVEIVPLEEQYGGQPIVDTGVIGGPFNGLFENLAGVMARMRQQMDYLLRRLPFAGNRTASGESPFPGFPQIDLGKGNTTSVTKLIDGHKVVINETEYKQDGELGGTFFKVRIIDVQPDSSELTTEKDAEEVTSRAESVESSFENEIPKNREAEVASNIETFDELDSNQPFEKILDNKKQWDEIEPFESFEDNSIESVNRPDLSRDTYVNELMNDAGVPPNPDAEVFSSVELNVPSRPRFEKLTDPR